MKPFEYARPTTEAEAVEFLGEAGVQAVILAGGTDLTSLMRAELVSPTRVVDLKQIPSLHQVTRLEGGVQIGALVTLADLAKNSLLSFVVRCRRWGSLDSSSGEWHDRRRSVSSAELLVFS